MSKEILPNIAITAQALDFGYRGKTVLPDKGYLTKSISASNSLLSSFGLIGCPDPPSMKTSNLFHISLVYKAKVWLILFKMYQ